MAEKKKYVGSSSYEYERSNKLVQRAKLSERIDKLKAKIANGEYPRPAQKRWAERRLAKLQAKLENLRAEAAQKKALKNRATPNTD